MKIIAWLMLVIFCLATEARAACSGSGTTWNCTAGTTSAQISTALGSASDGATLTFAAGSYSWGTFVSFSNTKGASIVCATPGGCNVSASGTVLGMNDVLSGANAKFYRISGFKFTGGNFILWFYGEGNSSLSQFRIDNNTFNVSSGSTAVMFGYNGASNLFSGVMDHNTFLSSGSIAAFQYIGTLPTTPPPSPAGTSRNIFFENNTITVTTMNNAGLGCMDIQGGQGVVFRHNQYTNCLVTSHGATHEGGPPNIEFYNNSAIVNSGANNQGVSDCYRCFHSQGSGELYAFGNRFTASGGKSGAALAVMDYRAYANSIDGGAPICDGTHTAAFGDGGHDGNRSPATTYRGYPCWHQPGRDFAVTPAGGNLRPMYAWDNAWTDTGAQVSLEFEDIGGSPDYTPQHAVANRDYFNAVSSFDGTTGMGFGLAANRPATCSVALTDPGDAGKGGVGYFATDQNILYRCASANTWVAHYSPYTYPHPLVSAGGGNPPQAPIGVVLQFTLQP